MSDKPTEYCPECGVCLKKRSREGHANSHWPLSIPDKDLGKKAAKRRRAILGVD